MNALKTLLCIAVVFLSNPELLHCQQAISASGSDASSMEGSISYTLGQVFYNFDSNSTINISEGVQQAFEISTTTYVEPLSNARVVISVFPNPTTTILTIQISGELLPAMHYRLTDVTGRTLLIGEMNASTLDLNMQNLPASVYFLQIKSSETRIATHRIIKS